jgi:hypothetical protein
MEISYLHGWKLLSQKRPYDISFLLEISDEKHIIFGSELGLSELAVIMVHLQI